MFFLQKPTKELEGQGPLSGVMSLEIVFIASAVASNA
jgi:hypothetical protein